MNPFLRRMSLLLVLLVLAGCGRGRGTTPPGKPYAVTFAAGVWISPATSTTSRASSRDSSGGVTVFSGSGNFNCGSGKDALVGVVAVIAVVMVVAVVVCVVEAATSGPHHEPERYALTLSGEGVLPEVVIITASNHLYLDERQYAALAGGVYTRAVLRPAVWEGTQGAPTQEVRVSIARGQVTIAPLEPPSRAPMP